MSSRGGAGLRFSGSGGLGLWIFGLGLGRVGPGPDREVEARAGSGFGFSSSGRVGPRLNYEVKALSFDWKNEMKLMIPFFQSEFNTLQFWAKKFWRISTLWRFWRFSVAILGLIMNVNIIDIVRVFFGL